MDIAGMRDEQTKTKGEQTLKTMLIAAHTGKRNGRAYTIPFDLNHRAISIQLIHATWGGVKRDQSGFYLHYLVSTMGQAHA